MKEELPQSVLAVTGRDGSVITAYLAAGLTSMANLFEAIQPVIGGISSIILLIIAMVVSRKKYMMFAREIELREREAAKEIELKDAQIRAISERKQERG